MRRHLLLLIAAQLITGCARQAPAPTPPPAVEQPTPTAAPADPATPSPAPAPTETGLQPEPAGGLPALLKTAPAETFQRLTIPAGQPINREGLFFLQVATGAVEGWVFADPTGYPFLGVSDDSRWITASVQGAQYLAERKTGKTYAWKGQAAHLITVRGDVALFMTGTQFWVAKSGLTTFLPTGLPAAAGSMAKIAPDGKRAFLLAGPKLYAIEMETGKYHELAQINPPGYTPEGPFQSVTGGVQVQSLQAGRTGVQTLRYTWEGRLVSDLVTPGTTYPAPDGRLLAWHESLLDLADAVVIGASPLEPRLRMRGEASCSLPYQGPYWLQDSSGLMLSTTRGPRLLKTDGTLQTLNLPEKGQGWGVPVPAPDRPNLYAYSGYMVIDGSGKLLAAAVPHSEGQFYGTGSSRIHPWGETSDEVRFLLRSSGKGVSCDPYIFPPEVEKAPFPAIAAVEVKVAAGDCVNLRQEFTKESAVVTCLPNGSRLIAAEPPGRNNKGWLERWGNPVPLSMGGEYWWHVRTEKGERGWVYLDSGYLSLVAARPGEPARDPVKTRLEDEVANLRYWFRLSLGELPCTKAGCTEGPSIQANIWGLTEWCKGAPDELRKLPGFDPARHGAQFAPVEKTCLALSEATKRLGEPTDDSAAWRQKVKELLAGLPQQN